jgi:hypothetical protein
MNYELFLGRAPPHVGSGYPLYCSPPGQHLIVERAPKAGSNAAAIPHACAPPVSQLEAFTYAQKIEGDEQ